eukprot:UN24530
MISYKTTGKFSGRYCYNDIVYLTGDRTGTIKFTGITSHSKKASDIYFGIALSRPIGKHNGMFEGRRYFNAKKKCGIFAKRNQIVNIISEGPPPRNYVGQKVRVMNKGRGEIKFIGLTKFAEGLWYGLELQNKQKKNVKGVKGTNGKVKGVQYFIAKPGHGIFVRSNKIEPLDEDELDEDGE